MKNFSLKVIPLGGLGEIGRNMMVLEYGEEILMDKNQAHLHTDQTIYQPMSGNTLLFHIIVVLLPFT